MTRSTVVAIVALALAGAGCSGARVARKAAAPGAPRRTTQPAAQLVGADTMSLPGQPQGFAFDREGAIVEVSDERVVAFDPQGEAQWATPVVGAAYGWPWLGQGIAVVPTLGADDLARDDAGPGGCVALDRATGAIRWSYEEDGRSGAAVAALDDRVYCVFKDGTMAAIAIETGELVWRAVVDERPKPAAVDVAERTALALDRATGTLAFTAQWGAHQYLVLRALTTGAAIGHFDLGTGSSSAPVSIRPGEIAFGHDAGYECVVDLRRRVRLPCLDLRATDGYDPASIPVVIDDTLVIAGRDGSVSAVDLDRKRVRWTRMLPTPILDARPVVSGGVVLVADGTRTTWAFRLADGSKIEAPTVDGFVVSAAADPGGGFLVAERGDWNGRIRRWRPTG